MRHFFKYVLIIICAAGQQSVAQNRGINWTADGTGYYSIQESGILRHDPKSDAQTVVASKELLTPAGANAPLVVQSFDYSPNNSSMLLFANTARVWRYKTRGDYWLLTPASKQLKKLGNGLPSQSLMFAKFSPDGKYVAYVSQNNLYLEDVNTGLIRKLTSDGSRKLINGTFDWVYEEEFGCRDGFRFSPDGRQIAFWQVDATR
ncbi:MAG: S9 family peptidase, partial [Chitinophagaceae bacterium]